MSSTASTPASLSSVVQPPVSMTIPVLSAGGTSTLSNRRWATSGSGGNVEGEAGRGRLGSIAAAEETWSPTAGRDGAVRRSVVQVLADGLDDGVERGVALTGEEVELAVAGADGGDAGLGRILLGVADDVANVDLAAATDVDLVCGDAEGDVRAAGAAGHLAVVDGIEQDRLRREVEAVRVGVRVEDGERDAVRTADGEVRLDRVEFVLELRAELLADVLGEVALLVLEQEVGDEFALVLVGL